MSSIGTRLKELRIKSGLKQPDVALKLGLSNGQISKIESDKSNNLTVKTVLAYMQLFSVSADYIITGTTTIPYCEDEKGLLELYYKLPDNFKEKVHSFMEIAAYEPSDNVLDNCILKEIPIYTPNLKYQVPVLGYSAAGSPIMAIENVLTFIETNMPHISFALYIKGNSMQPTINDGDAVFIKKVPFVENGEIGIIQIEDDVTCKKFYDFTDRIELHSINPNFKPLIYLKNSLTNIQIIGKVILTDIQKGNY